MIKRTIAVLMTLVLLASFVACGAEPSVETTMESETKSTSEKTTYIPIDEETKNPLMSESFPNEYGSNLPVTQEDIELLETMAYSFDFTEDYDCLKDSGDRFIHYGLFGGVISEYLHYYELADVENYYLYEKKDPLDLIGFYGEEYHLSLRWAKIKTEDVEYIVKNIFNNHLNEPGNPQDTIKNGYYYLDGYYYIALEIGGLEEVCTRVTTCELGTNDCYIIRIDWMNGFTGEIYSILQVEATLKNIDGHRMWTIYKMKPVTEVPFQPQG